MFHFFELFISFFTEPVMGEAVNYAIGPLAAAGISIGSSLLGKGANALFNDRPDAPDFSSEVAGQFQEARRQLEEDQEQQIDEVQTEASAAGVNPVSAVADVVDSNNQAQADLLAKERDAVARAENRERQLEFDQDRRSFQNTAQGIGGIVSGVSNFATNKAIIDQLSEDDESDGGGGGDNGGESGGSAASANGNGGVSTSSGSTLGASASANPLGGGRAFFLELLAQGQRDQSNPLFAQLALDGAEGFFGNLAQ